jgi:hypothetical protein
MKFILICICFSAGLAASSQIKTDSLKSTISRINYGFYVVSQSGKNVPPPGSFVRCQLSCAERQMFEKVNNQQWAELMQTDSQLGLKTIALLYDLFKKTCILFQHTEIKNPDNWRSVYWEAETREWKKYLETNSYKYKKEDCW